MQTLLCPAESLQREEPPPEARLPVRGRLPPRTAFRARPRRKRSPGFRSATAGQRASVRRLEPSAPQFPERGRWIWPTEGSQRLRRLSAEAKPQRPKAPAAFASNVQPFLDTAGLLWSASPCLPSVRLRVGSKPRSGPHYPARV